MAVATPAEIAELAALAAERRAVLLADVNAFVAHGLLDGAPLAGLAGAVGYRNVAYDLLLLRNLRRLDGGGSPAPLYLTYQARLVAAVREGLEQAEAGQTVDQDALSRLLDARFGTSPSEE